METLNISIFFILLITPSLVLTADEQTSFNDMNDIILIRVKQQAAEAAMLAVCKTFLVSVTDIMTTRIKDINEELGLFKNKDFPTGAITYKIPAARKFGNDTEANAALRCGQQQMETFLNNKDVEAFLDHTRKIAVPLKSAAIPISYRRASEETTKELNNCLDPLIPDYAKNIVESCN